jgi:hypothetical protein
MEGAGRDIFSCSLMGGVGSGSFVDGLLGDFGGVPALKGCVCLTVTGDSLLP